MATWKERAKAARADGHLAPRMEAMLERHLKQFFPELVKELGAELPDYLTVQAADAMEVYLRLTDEGTNPETAMELAREQLLPTPPDEVDRPEPWEQEAGQADSEAAALKALLHNPSQSKPARKTQLT